MADTSNPTTPKRKRGKDTMLTPIKFSFDPRAAAVEDGNSSPRSKVAHKFRGLDLGSQATANDADAIDDFDSPPKRQRSDETSSQLPPQVVTDIQETTEPQSETANVKDTSEGSLQHGYPSINRLSESKSRKKRSGTPPLRLRKGPIPEVDNEDDDSADDEEMEIVDPVRASLTWHEHEITVYDPDDEDDDGTGINGIGFKPTPALAHARTVKRRQQMAEYRKREESDERTKRSQRRRGAPAMAAGVEGGSPRKVRFTEAEHQNLAITTG